MDHETTAKTISQTLTAHGVQARYATEFAGPTVTQYAFALERGTHVKRVHNLTDDIALALGLKSVRILAPIPGTTYVGIEVPREDRENVLYSDFVDLEDGPTGPNLPIPVGVDVTSEPIWSDLTGLPHLLIAGTTMSGKSVAVTSLVTSLIEHKTPDEARLWLIDPKRVELACFADAPHVETIATDVDDALDAIRAVEDIMDHRYNLFAEAGVKNITEWNDVETPGERADTMPYQVLVVDELADLMMTSGKAVEAPLVRIAQLGRAAGVHLVLATQRPTKDVVTGLISANVVARWSFLVESSTDSMVALGRSGAQHLIGQGDSLWKPGGSDPVRVQSVYTSPTTVKSVVEEAEALFSDVDTTASPRAADDDDNLTLEDLGIDEAAEQDHIVVEPDPVAPVRDATLPGEDPRDLARRVADRVVKRDRSLGWLDRQPQPDEATTKPAVAHIVDGSSDAAIAKYVQEQIEERLRASRRPWWKTFGIGVAGGLTAICLVGWAANIIQALA